MHSMAIGCEPLKEMGNWLDLIRAPINSQCVQVALPLARSAPFYLIARAASHCSFQPSEPFEAADRSWAYRCDDFSVQD